MSASEPVSAARRQALDEAIKACETVRDFWVQFHSVAPIAVLDCIRGLEALRDAAPSPAALPCTHRTIAAYDEAVCCKGCDTIWHDDDARRVWHEDETRRRILIDGPTPSRPSTTTVSIDPSHRSHTTTTPSTSPPASSGASAEKKCYVCGLVGYEFADAQHHCAESIPIPRRQSAETPSETPRFTAYDIRLIAGEIESMGMEENEYQRDTVVAMLRELQRLVSEPPPARTPDSKEQA